MWATASFTMVGFYSLCMTKMYIHNVIFLVSFVKLRTSWCVSLTPHCVLHPWQETLWWETCTTNDVSHYTCAATIPVWMYLLQSRCVSLWHPVALVCMSGTFKVNEKNYSYLQDVFWCNHTHCTNKKRRETDSDWWTCMFSVKLMEMERGILEDRYDCLVRFFFAGLFVSNLFMLVCLWVWLSIADFTVLLTSSVIKFTTLTFVS